MDAKERIETVQSMSGLKWKALANALGMNSPQTFADIRNGRHGISPRLADKIIAILPNLRKEWLVLGEGSMTVEESARNIPMYEMGKSDSDTTIINVGSCFPNAEMALRHKDCGMREYPNGCILILRRVMDESLIVPGHNYVVETKEFVIAKRVQKGKDDNHITLYSTDETKYADGRLVHEPFEVSMESVSRIFAILGYIYPQTSEITNAES